MKPSAALSKAGKDETSPLRSRSSGTCSSPNRRSSCGCCSCWLKRRPKVLIVGQPTRGVDIGAIEFIHRRLVALRDAGVAILIVSVELEELLALSDRVLVMCGGRITGERRPDATDERDLGLLMAGVEAA